MNRPSRILVVDDSSTKAYLLKSLLDKAGYQVDVVRSGEKALSYLSVRTPDLILLDIIMPGMDGFEVCRALKADQEKQGIPIIFITTLAHTKAKLEGFAAGGEDYIPEPFVEEEVLARVNVTLTRKHAEEALRRKTHELESYTCVVSHDLKEPLRTISRFAEILLARYGDKLDEEGQVFLNRIHSSCQRMTFLIDDLLILTRAGRIDAKLSEVELSTLVEEVKLDLAEIIAGKKATIVYGQLPRVYCQKVWMSEVLKNLVSNGIKYNHSSNPEVTISCEDRETVWEVSVSDNGIGIEDQYREKVFGLFQRLHPHDRYEGTGAGLAIVRTIVEEHEGRVWVAESSADSGTVITLTISKDLAIR
jgi:two-component system sensor histidine kinase/response regulator